MPETDEAISLKAVIGDSVKNVERFVIGPAGSEVAAILVMMILVGLFTAPLALLADAKVSANGQAPTNPCAGQIVANSTTQTANQVQVSDASGKSNSLDVYTGRSGGMVQRVSAPLSVQSGLLPPNLCIGTVVSDLVRSDGEVLPSNQVTSWGLTGNAGRRVFVYIAVSPRYGQVTPAGGYTGTVSMDDDRAVGGLIPVDVHVEYPRLWRASMVCIVAAWCGFFWAWLIHLTRADIPTAGRFWLYIILQLAVLTIVSFPVLNAQILTNPDWTGDVSQYIALASLAGGGALATTPTLRALVDRAAIFMPGASPGPSPHAASGPTAATAGTTAPAASQDATAGGPSGTNGDSPVVPDGTDGGSSSVPSVPPAGTNGGSSSAQPGGTNGGSSSVPSTPPGPDDGSTPSATPGGPDDGSSGSPAVPVGGPDDGSPSTASTPPGGPDDGSSGTPAVPVGGPDDGGPSAPDVPSAPAVPAGAPAGPMIPIAPSEN